MPSPMLPRGRWPGGKSVILAVQMTEQELDSFLLQALDFGPSSTFVPIVLSTARGARTAGTKNLRRQRGREH